MAATIEEQIPATTVADPAPTPATGKKKAIKAKKAAAARKPKAHSHPSYNEMISDAITSLKERSGSSQIAITKFIEDKHKTHLPTNFRKLLLVQLKKLVAAGKLVKVKASFKLSPTKTAVKPKVVAKPKAKTKAVAKPKPKTKAAAAAAKPKVVKPKSKPAAAKPKTVAKTKAVAKPKAKVAAKAAAKVKGVVKAKAAKTKKAAPAKPKTVKKTPAKKAKK